MGGGMGRAAPCAMRHLSAGFPGGRARRHCGAGASAPETRGGRGAGVRAAREREGGSLAAEVPRRVGSTEGEEPPAAAPPASGGRSLRDGLRERAQLVDVVPEQGPAGVDDDHVDAVEADRDVALGGVALQPSGSQQLELLAGEVPLA